MANSARKFEGFVDSKAELSTNPFRIRAVEGGEFETLSALIEAEKEEALAKVHAITKAAAKDIRQEKDLLEKVKKSAAEAVAELLQASIASQQKLAEVLK